MNAKEENVKEEKKEMTEKKETISLRKLLEWTEAQKVNVGNRKRFDYDAIRDELIRICENGKKFVPLGIVKHVMMKHSNRQGPIHYNQIRSCIERLHSREDTKVLVDVTVTPRLYTFVEVKETAKKAK